ncbi:DUF3944 domain-containing protein [Morganella morganii]|uniref:DUF3944 domain-containing protein n=1 Tax=Morganella morganii TaxID=582 RepID=UPI0021CE1B07|nr:DUF3944 domain-containing protein [Morganella morganii]MCU6376620.1 DUF3944 domain-containing protein [Morganella morganii]
MATYRIDPDLAFIGQCSNEDLGLLVSVLTHDSKDGKKRLAESLTASPEYQLFYPDHQKYWPAICAELQAFGANSLATLLRGNKGVLYREILLDVCSRMKVKHAKGDSTETAEINLLMQILKTSISDMSPAALAALSQEMKLNLTNPTPQLVMMALQAAVNVSGVAALELASIASFGVIQAMGGMATTAGTAGMASVFFGSRILGILAGPVGIALSSAWLIADIAGPAYRVTVPACIIVAYLRQKALAA